MPPTSSCGFNTGALESLIQPPLPSLHLQEPDGNWRTIVFLLLSSAASPFLLSIPWGFSTIGWGPGLAFLLVCLAATAFTSCLFASLADDGVTRHNSLGELADAIYGG